MARHCWQDHHDWIRLTQGEDAYWAVFAEPNATCMSESGHSGDHDWILDNEIEIQFTGERDEGND